MKRCYNVLKVKDYELGQSRGTIKCKYENRVSLVVGGLPSMYDICV